MNSPQFSSSSGLPGISTPHSFKNETSSESDRLNSSTAEIVLELSADTVKIFADKNTMMNANIVIADIILRIINILSLKSIIHYFL